MMVLKQRRSLCLDAANLEVEEVWQKKRDEEQEESAVVPSQLSVSGSVSVLLKTGGSGYIPH